MTWIDTIVVTVVIVGALLIFYRALKEPLDKVGAGIKAILVGIGGKISDMKDNADYAEVIQYG